MYCFGPTETGTRRGFTLIELLVTIMVVSILLAILSPAVQLARETAHRASCKNRLRQLTVGCLNYESANGYFPAGCVIGQGAGWSAYILNQIEEKVIADRVELNDTSLDISGSGNASNWTNGVNEEVCATFISTFRCPMDPVYDHIDSGSSFGSPAMKDRVPSSYIGVASGTTKNYSDLYWSGSKTREDVGDAKSGIIIPTQRAAYYKNYRWNSRIGVRDIRDGASYTLMLGETIFDTSQYDLTGGGTASKGIDHWYIGSYNIDANQDFSEFLGSTKVPLNMYHRYGDELLAAMSNGQKAARFKEMSFAFGSWHADDGVTFSFADGATRFIKADIDPDLYANLGNRADNEEVSQYFK